VNFWDEISIDRIVAWAKQEDSDGNVNKIAASAVTRSGEIVPSSTAVLEQEDKTPWDSTVMGHIVKWMTVGISGRTSASQEEMLINGEARKIHRHCVLNSETSGANDCC
jgi:hypothetical protein